MIWITAVTESGMMTWRATLGCARQQQGDYDHHEAEPHVLGVHNRSGRLMIYLDDLARRVDPFTTSRFPGRRACCSPVARPGGAPPPNVRRVPGAHSPQYWSSSALLPALVYLWTISIVITGSAFHVASQKRLILPVPPPPRARAALGRMTTDGRSVQCCVGAAQQPAWAV